MRQPSITIGKDIVQLVAEVDEFEKQWRTANKLSPARLEQLRRTAFIESVGASARMAGATLTNAQVEALLSGSDVHNRDGALAAGYADTLERVLEEHQDLDLTPEHLGDLHRTLLRHSDSGEHEADSGSRAARDDGKTQELQDLLRWTSDALNEATMHPLLITAIFHVLFQAIQPFQEGNGRLARILTDLLLLRAGYDYLPYTSFEAVIEKEKDYYRKALQRTQTTLDHDSPDWQPWFAFFLRYLKMQKAKLAPAIEQIEGVDSQELPALSMDVLVLLSQHGELSLAQMSEMTGADKKDVELRLKELTEAGHIQSRGEGRYSLAH
ncbi:Fic family protein [Proteobacteria bacterium 005FR1]|nr:Fic family protein [Proteobacteria bacterium 005FR1]